ncbi:MAG: histidinol-phosphate transaminase [Chloroflexi bacterium]|nr:histidinol-phosphate transaminase [Chloroflexota bacterium]
MTHSGLILDPNILAAPTYNRGMTVKNLPSSVNPTDMVQMASNENPLGPSPQVITAVQSEAWRLSVYPPGDGEQNLRAALAEMHGRSGNGRYLTADNIIVGNGGLDVLDFVARGFAKPGDEIIISHPTFNFFEITARRLGASIVNVPLDSGFDYDVEAVLAAVTEKTRVVYVCNPNNPTGNLVSAASIDHLMQNLPERVLVLSDEAYNHFADDTFPDTGKYIHQGRNLLQLHSFSKVFGLAGLRLGYGITRPEIAEYLARLKRPFHLGRLTIIAGLTAVNDQSHVQKTIKTMVSGRGWLTNQLTELGLKVYPSHGNFLLMAAGIPGQELTQQLLQYGIIVSSGQQRFGLPDHIRVTVGLPEHNQRLVEAMASILKSYKALLETRN